MPSTRNELEEVIAGDSASAPPARILQGLSSGAADRAVAGAPHTIYEELWHIVFWQQITLDWIAAIQNSLSRPRIRWVSARGPIRAGKLGEPLRALLPRQPHRGRRGA